MINTLVTCHKCPFLLDKFIYFHSAWSTCGQQLDKSNYHFDLILNNREEKKKFSLKLM